MFFIYFGEVNPVFKAAATAIRPGGLLAFSTESGPDAGYRLLPSGRFAHAPDYVRAMAGENFVEEFLRRNNRSPGSHSAAEWASFCLSA